MWIASFRQFLNRSLQCFANWLRGLERLPGRLFQRQSELQNLPALEGYGTGKVAYSRDPLSGRWRADLTYHSRSLTCQLRVSELEPSPGMQHIHTVLQGVDKG